MTNKHFEKDKKILVKISRDMHRLLKSYTVAHDTSIQDVVAGLIHEKLRDK